MNPVGMIDLQADLPMLRELVALAAAEELMPRFRHISHDLKADGSLVTEADLTMQGRLQRELASRYPAIQLLGEEMTTAEQQALLDRPEAALWCLDPLDGTSNFAAGIPYFAVSLALLVGGRPVLGLVYDPTRDECFSAIRGVGAWLGSVRLRTPAGQGLENSIAMVDFKRLSAPLAARVASRPPFRSQRNFGASALDWCWLAAGRFQLYLHGGQRLWDFTAGSLILDEAGGSASNLQGEDVVQLDDASRKQSVVAAVDPALYAAWFRWLADVPDAND